jgi:hypothetical protein
MKIKKKTKLTKEQMEMTDWQIFHFCWAIHIRPDRKWICTMVSATKGIYVNLQICKKCFWRNKNKACITRTVFKAEHRK